jgi:hypothetical protein
MDKSFEGGIGTVRAGQEGGGGGQGGGRGGQHWQGIGHSWCGETEQLTRGPPPSGTSNTLVILSLNSSSVQQI